MNEPVGAIYDTVYARMADSALFQEILREVLGDDYVDGAASFSYLKRPEVETIATILRGLDDAYGGLELGCGVGGLTGRLAGNHGGRWIGLDISPAAIRQAANRHRTCAAAHRPRFVVGSMLALPFPSATFDCVVAIDAIQHGQPYQVAAREIARVLNPHGALIFTNWMGKLPLSQLQTADPLLTALGDNGLRLASASDTDPGLTKQIQIYVALHERRAEVEREIGPAFFAMMLREARHLGAMRHQVCRALTIAYKT